MRGARGRGRGYRGYAHRGGHQPHAHHREFEAAGEGDDSVEGLAREYEHIAGGGLSDDNWRDLQSREPAEAIDFLNKLLQSAASTRHIRNANGFFRTIFNGTRWSSGPKEGRVRVPVGNRVFWLAPDVNELIDALHCAMGFTVDLRTWDQMQRADQTHVLAVLHDVQVQRPPPRHLDEFILEHLHRAEFPQLGAEASSSKPPVRNRNEPQLCFDCDPPIAHDGPCPLHSQPVAAPAASPAAPTSAAASRPQPEPPEEQHGPAAAAPVEHVQESSEPAAGTAAAAEAAAGAAGARGRKNKKKGRKEDAEIERYQPPAARTAAAAEQVKEDDWEVVDRQDGEEPAPAETYASAPDAPAHASATSTATSTPLPEASALPPGPAPTPALAEAPPPPQQPPPPPAPAASWPAPPAPPAPSAVGLAPLSAAPAQPAPATPAPAPQPSAAPARPPAVPAPAPAAAPASTAPSGQQPHVQSAWGRGAPGFNLPPPPAYNPLGRPAAGAPPVPAPAAAAQHAAAAAATNDQLVNMKNALDSEKARSAALQQELDRVQQELDRVQKQLRDQRQDVEKAKSAWAAMAPVRGRLQSLEETLAAERAARGAAEREAADLRAATTNNVDGERRLRERADKAEEVVNQLKAGQKADRERILSLELELKRLRGSGPEAPLASPAADAALEVVPVIFSRGDKTAVPENVLELLTPQWAGLEPPPPARFALRRAAPADVAASRPRVAVVVGQAASDRIDKQEKAAVDDARAKGAMNVVLVIFRISSDPSKVPPAADATIDSSVGAEKRIIRLVQFQSQLVAHEENRREVGRLLEMLGQAFADP